jgi:glycosyltransferase involved in cell wall biosynthesis
MKVCILTSAHAALDDRIFYKQARSLARAGHEVVLCAPGDVERTADGVRIIAVRGHRRRLFRMLLTMLRLGRRALETRAAVYHFHDPELIPLGLVLRALGRHVIYDVHEYTAEDVLRKMWVLPRLRRPVSSLVRWLDALAVSRMSATVVVTDDMVRMFQGHVRRRDRLVAIHNYPELTVPTDADKEYADRDSIAIYVGGISRDRGLEVLLEAGRTLRERSSLARIQILGPLDLAGVASRYTTVQSWPRDGVEHLGVVDHSEVSSWLGRARIGLVPLLPTPSFIKSVPIKLFEYMRAGLPVVASDFGCMREVLRETGCGLLVPPGDPAALASAVQVLLDDPEGAREIGRRGRAAVLAKYNWDLEARELLALYERLGRER